MVQLPQRDFCHPGTCVPAIKGEVQNADGSPVARYLVTIKLESQLFGVAYCPVGDESKMLQPGEFKFESPDGQTFGEYKLTVVANDRTTPLSQTYTLGMAPGKGNHWGIIFRHK
jgi:hypothetical protein